MADDGNTARAADFPVVGIGASAGGITALQTLLRALPASPELALVVVQHQRLGQTNRLSELLRRWTPFTVRDAADGVALEPGCLFVAQADSALTLVNGVFVTRALEGTMPRTGIDTIDNFFDSLARDVGRRAVAVVLSGTGADGAAGAIRVKQAGGMVLVQDPTSAMHDGMPKAAITSGAVDHIMPLGLLAAELVACASPAYERSASAGCWADDVTKAFDAIMELLRSEAGIDLTGHKTTPLLSRIQRRMEHRRVPLFRDYHSLLCDDPAEFEALVRGIPIHVTEFFRDADAWGALERRVIPALVREAGDAGIRVWTPACATGEEAYSVAMLLEEQASLSDNPPNFTVFATDISAEIIGRASRGAFRPSSVDSLSPARRQRFFYAVDGTLRVKRELRERMVFATQDLLTDPPFPALDLVTCRNLFIYLEGEATARVVALLHSALRVGGYLFLGKGESLPTRPHSGFEEIEPNTRIYRKTELGSALAVAFPRRPSRLRPDGSSSRAIEAHAHEAALAENELPAVLVDDQLQILRLYGDTSGFLRLKPGEPSLNLAHVLRIPAIHLEVAVQQAQRNDGAVTIGGLLDPETDQLALSLRVTPLTTPEGGAERFLVAFIRDATVAATETPLAGGTGIDATDRADWSEALRLTHEELDASREELQALNEELRASNDQLNIANLDLNQANQQLREKVDELLTQSNVLSSGAVLTLFLDETLKVRWFTPGVSELFPLKTGDIGRPITDLVPKFHRPEFLDDVRAVMQSGAPREAIVLTHEGRSFLKRIRPFRTRRAEGSSAGVAINFTDVTERARVEAALRASEDALRVSEAALAAELGTLKILHAFSTATAEARDVNALLELALDTLTGLHGADMGNVQLYDPELGALRIAVQRGFEPWFLAHFTRVSFDERSACGRALACQKRVCFEDVEDPSVDAGFRDVALRAGYRAVQSTPLTAAGGEPIGVLSTHFREPRRLTDAECKLTDILANELSGAIERARAAQALRLSERTLRGNQAWVAAQKEAFQSAMNGLPIQTSLGVLTRAVVEQAAPSCRCALYMADSKGRLRHVVGMPGSYAERVDGLEISPECMACELAVTAGEPMLTRDVLEEQRWKPWTELALDFGYRGCWSFPVETATGKLVGSLAMYFAAPHAPTPRDIELAATLTKTAAMIISHYQDQPHGP